MKKAKKCWWLLFPISCLIISPAAGCGYQWAGKYSSTSSKEFLLAIPVVTNRTDYPGIEGMLTRQLIQTIEQKGIGRVVERKKAEAVLIGKILSLTTTTSYYDANTDRVAGYTLQMVAEFTLIRSSDGKVIWKLVSSPGKEFYDTRSNALLTESNFQDALTRLTERIATDLAERWGGGW